MNGDFYDLPPETRKLCSEALCKDVKTKELLATYYNSLSEAEKACFDGLSKRFWNFYKCGARKYKISKNAVLVAVRLKDELSLSCYPFIEKIATKGWSTSDGTFSWSMPVLGSGDIEREICSFEPAAMFVNKKYKLSIGSYNGFAVVSAD